MSLNWREIDAVLAEMDLEGCWLKRVRQPDYARLILEFSRPGFSRNLEIVVRAPFVRINALGTKRRLPRALPKPPRFAAVLKSRLEGARLKDFRQLGRDRIVRFTFLSAGEELHLDAKLWGNGANLILCGSDSLIIDAFSRRPGRKESPGESWPPEGVGREDAVNGDSERFSLRDLPGDGSWNDRIEALYLGLEDEAERRIRLGRWRSWLNERENVLASRESRLTESRRRFESRLRNGHWADLIMAHLHSLQKGIDHLECEDWENPGETVRIPLKPTLSPRENAEAFYAGQKRAERALERLEEDAEILARETGELKVLSGRLEIGDTDGAPFDDDPPETRRQKKGGGEAPPGLWIRKDPFIIAVGRNARESDWLLRRWAKGNDTWLHARDWPGGHVFIRAPRGKSIPLDLLLDGGNLALSYSRGRRNRDADLYYTQVKNLRRAKDGPTGAVLPTREKNLRISLDETRLEALRNLAETG